LDIYYLLQQYFHSIESCDCNCFLLFSTFFFAQKWCVVIFWGCDAFDSFVWLHVRFTENSLIQCLLWSFTNTILLWILICFIFVFTSIVSMYVVTQLIHFWLDSFYVLLCLKKVLALNNLSNFEIVNIKMLDRVVICVDT